MVFRRDGKKKLVKIYIDSDAVPEVCLGCRVNDCARCYCSKPIGGWHKASKVVYPSN